MFEISCCSVKKNWKYIVKTQFVCSSIFLMIGVFLFIYILLFLILYLIAEQRRVLGPASSVDTNLYIESWQQQDNQPAIQFPSSASPLVSHRSPPQRSVSACPSPVPVRTYRLGPASASASPVVSARGLGPSRGRMRGTFVSPAYTLSNSSSGVALSGCSSLATT